jgi:hypothetical protein
MILLHLLDRLITLSCDTGHSSLARKSCSVNYPIVWVFPDNQRSAGAETGIADERSAANSFLTICVLGDSTWRLTQNNRDPAQDNTRARTLKN